MRSTQVSGEILKILAGVVFGVSALVLAMYLAYRSGWNHAADEMLHAQCARVTEGMTEGDALAIMGSPNSERVPEQNPNERHLTYERHFLYASGPVVIKLSKAESQSEARSQDHYLVSGTVCADIW